MSAQVSTSILSRRPDALAAINPYAWGLLLASAAFAFTLGLQQIYHSRPPIFAFFAAIAAAGWFGGRRAGFLAVAISVPLGLYFYAMARPDHAVHIRDITIFIFFVICAFAGGTLNQRWRLAQEGLSAADRALQEKALALQDANDALEEEMAERQRAELVLDAMRSELARVSRLTSMAEMAASIAHEINQPLTAISTNAGAAMRWLNTSPPNLDEARAAASRAVSEAERASAVVARVRAMVRNALAERKAVSLQECLAEVLALLAPQLAKDGVALDHDIAADIPAIIGDRIQLQQVFFNLLTNAAESLSQVNGRARRIAITARLHEEHALQIDIQDNGAGFGEGMLQELFQSFVTTKSGGMGMGLAISRGIIEAHGGSLTAASATPFGAIFSIQLPLRENRP